MPRPSALSLLSTLLAFNALPAQQALPGATRLNWETVIVFTIPDKVEGVRVQVIAGPVPSQPMRGFVGRFDPAAIRGWIEHAESVLTNPLPQRRTASVPTQIQTPILTDLTGGGAILGRVYDGMGWRPGVFLYLAENWDGQPLLIQTDVARARELLVALQRAAERSWVDTLVVARGELTPSRALPGDSDAVPLLRSFKRPVYPPQSLRRGIEGEVLARFIVDSSGRVQRGSVELLWATDRAFGESARRGLETARFWPARRQGAPVSSRMYYRVVFRMAGTSIAVT